MLEVLIPSSISAKYKVMMMMMMMVVVVVLRTLHVSADKARIRLLRLHYATIYMVRR